ncbi:MAG: hypothetical protein R3336_00505, partial [Phycisphaeraceae bacterium]|nr:hypothetical protein [Phycisphaeraceae bacterium]
MNIELITSWGWLGAVALTAAGGAAGALIAWAGRWRWAAGLTLAVSAAVVGLLLLAAVGGVAWVWLAGLLAGGGAGLGLTWLPASTEASDRRITRAAGLSVLLTLVAVGLVRVQGEWRMSRIELDQSAIREAELERQKAERERQLAKLRSRASGIQFAEDTEADRLDLAGVKENKYDSIYEAAAAGEPVDQVPAWKQGGKKERATGRSRDTGDTDSQVIDQAGEADQPVRPPIMLKPEMYQGVLTLQKWTGGLALWTLLMGLIILLVDYLRRFNGTLPTVMPLPISGRWIDQLFPRAMIVRMPADPEALRWYLQQVARRGESYLLLADEDPDPDRTRTGRLVL